MLILPRGHVERIWNIDNFTEQCISYHKMVRGVAYLGVKAALAGKDTNLQIERVVP